MPARWREPGGLLPPLAGNGATPGEAGLRDAIQRLALANPHYGYRRIGVLLGRDGWRANHKRVLRLMREDNLLGLRKAGFVPMTTDPKHGWRVVRLLEVLARVTPLPGAGYQLCGA